MKLFTIENLRCSYDHPYQEGVSRVVLEIKNLQLDRGEKVFIVGESGIGKSTILETLGMMNNTIVPDVQTKFLFHGLDGKDIDLCALWRAGDKALSKFRQEEYSFIFQSTNLMRNFTAYENVAYTRMLQGYNKKECYERTKQVLASLGLEHVDEARMAHELSGGQQQRLAFARAILPEFTVLFGDEPTGNLDADNAAKVMQIIATSVDEKKDTSAIIVSHDMHLATSFADVIIKIRKESRKSNNVSDEEITYGFIDDGCVFRPDKSRSKWSGGKGEYLTNDFEEYLRKK
ncbi:MAG: ATP-binding cassette domain-containing protein [Prevotella sp.]|nr:ATP-binding cassette domain-containing protein [Prevotella sp.]